MITDSTMLGWGMTIQDAVSGMFQYRHVPAGVVRVSSIFVRELTGMLQASSLQRRLMDRQRRPAQQRSDDECDSGSDDARSSSDDAASQD